MPLPRPKIKVSCPACGKDAGVLRREVSAVTRGRSNGTGFVKDEVATGPVAMKCPNGHEFEIVVNRNGH